MTIKFLLFIAFCFIICAAFVAFTGGDTNYTLIQNSNGGAQNLFDIFRAMLG